MLRAITLTLCVPLLQLWTLVPSMPTADAAADPVAETVKTVLPGIAADDEGVAAQCGLWIFKTFAGTRHVRKLRCEHLTSAAAWKKSRSSRLALLQTPTSPLSMATPSLLL